MPAEVEAKYPAHYEAEVLLKSGQKIMFRPIHREDTERWLAFINRLSDHTKYLRFHYIPKEFSQEDAQRYCTVDYFNTFAFVAEIRKGQRKEIIAIGRYYRLPTQNSAEISFAIEDGYQDVGIGTKLLEWLANVARDNGITMFEAEVLPENELMLTVFRDYGFHVTSQLAGDIIRVSFPIARTKRVEQKEQERERLSTVASLKYLLYPRSVAVVGASRKAGSIGQLLMEQLIRNDYAGVVYPINPNAESVMGVKTYPSIVDVPGQVDLAIVAVPAAFVSKVADECGQKGVRAIVVISDGFKERGAEGAARENELRSITLGHGMRLVGPNCMGIINTDPSVRINGTFSRIYPPHGNVAFLTQSGAMGLVILDYARNVNMGISTFVSVGNRADISPNDMLQYWEQDPQTKVILLYMESFGNPRHFSRIARRVSVKKPILVVKSGSTEAGSRAASSHTGAMATPEIVSDALFRQAGITRINSVEELFDVAILLANQPLPRGRRLAIVTNGGGPGIMAADACTRQGLTLTEFSAKTKEALKKVIKRDVSINNPIDVTAGASPEEFEGILKVLAEDPDVDAALPMFIPATAISPEEMQVAVSRAALVFQKQDKPLLACFIGQRGVQRKLASGKRFVPSFLFPEDAVVALARAAEHGEMVRKPKGVVPQFKGIKRDRAQEIIREVMQRSSKRPIWLSAEEIAELLACYGMRFVQTIIARTPGEAAATAAKIGFPVVIKLHSSTITHKTDVGGVVLDVKTEADVKKAFNDIKAKLAKIGKADEMEGVTIQRYVTGGVEAIVGVTQNPTFGPLIMFGLGGVYAELFKDVALRLHPLTDLDASELIESIKAVKLFDGFRGAPPADKAALADLLLRLSTMVEDVKEIAELDLNPVKVMPQGEGYWVVDARIMVK
ncbi:MAG: GNAT family N-acetyltransferase [Dehalococcoidales bacterium]|nr:GNAT family N-acetyltransferase [Dehalococcoidales bacterium]